MRGPTAEQSTSQKVIQFGAVVVVVLMLAALRLDRGASWSHVPFLASLAADAVVAGGFLVMFLALRENTFAAVNIVVEADHKVVSTGPYALVRHPYYTGLVAVALATPLALGSWWALAPVALILPLIAWRIRYEEGFLREHLAGYAEYCTSVRYRLIPRVW